jgi:hypothetical protein
MLETAFSKAEGPGVFLGSARLRKGLDLPPAYRKGPHAIFEGKRREASFCRE